MIPDSNEWNDDSIREDFQQGVEGVEEGEPIKKLSLRGTLAILLGLLILAIVVILVVRGIRIEKEPSAQNVAASDTSNSGENYQNQELPSEDSNGGITIEAENDSNLSDSESNSGKNLSDSGGSDRTSSSKINSSKSEEIQDIDVPKDTEETVYPSNSDTTKVTDIHKVSTPDLSESRTSSAMISSKSVLRVDNSSYAYCVNLVILVGEDDYKDIRYFCPKKTYDGVLEGDTLSVEYQTDSEGVVSISSITK